MFFAAYVFQMLPFSMNRKWIAIFIVARCGKWNTPFRTVRTPKGSASFTQ